MKHLFLSFMFGVLAIAACAQPIAYEPFDYPAGELLGFSTTTGQTNAASHYWFNGTGAFSDASIVSGSLSHPGFAASTGNSFTNGSGGSQQSNRFRFDPGVTNETFYASFLMRVDSLGGIFTGAPANQGIITAMGYFNSLGTFIQAGHLWIGTNGADLASFRLGSAKLASPGPPFSLVQWTTNGAGDTIYYPTGQTVLIVQSYTFNTGSSGDDDCQIWVNPDPSTFGSATPPPSVATAIITGSDIAFINLFNFRQNNAFQTPQSATFDELRIGTNWVDVTPPFAAPPPTLAIAASGPSAVLSWPTNATDYFLIYNGDIAVARTNWPSVTNTVSVNGTNFNVTVDLLPPMRFYSLIRTN